MLRYQSNKKERRKINNPNKIQLKKNYKSAQNIKS